MYSPARLAPGRRPGSSRSHRFDLFPVSFVLFHFFCAAWTALFSGAAFFVIPPRSTVFFFEAEKKFQVLARGEQATFSSIRGVPFRPGATVPFSL